MRGQLRVARTPADQTRIPRRRRHRATPARARPVVGGQLPSRPRRSPRALPDTRMGPRLILTPWCKGRPSVLASVFPDIPNGQWRTSRPRFPCPRAQRVGLRQRSFFAIMFDSKPDVSQGINHLNGRWRMSTTPAHGLGRDNDPARHAGSRPDNAASASGTGPAASASPASGMAASSGAGEVPLPAPSLAGWVPLPASSLDWLDDAGRAAGLAAREDEQEPADPDLEDGPPDFGGLAAVIAEAREITAAEARDAGYASRMVAGGGFGLVGAAPGHRGPGQPGSAKSFPGEHASPAAAFGSGLVLDTAPGCAVLAEFAGAVAGEDDRYPGATDDEIIGVICAWSRTEAHAAARKLAAVAEFVRRRPHRDCTPQGAAEGPRRDTPQGPAKDASQGPADSPGKGAPQDPEGPRRDTLQDPAKDASQGPADSPGKGVSQDPEGPRRDTLQDPAKDASQGP